MNITDIRLRPVEDGGKVKAIASITLDNCFVIHDLKVVEGNGGLFVAMPSRKGPDGVYRDIAHPIDPETRKQISDQVLEKFRQKQESSETSMEGQN